MWKEVVMPLAAGLQLMVDCMVLGVPNNITPIIVAGAIGLVWWHMEKKKQAKRRKRKPQFYDLREGMK